MQELQGQVEQEVVTVRTERKKRETAEKLCKKAVEDKVQFGRTCCVLNETLESHLVSHVNLPDCPSHQQSILPCVQTKQHSNTCASLLRTQAPGANTDAPATVLRCGKTKGTCQADCPMQPAADLSASLADAEVLTTTSDVD